MRSAPSGVLKYLVGCRQAVDDIHPFDNASHDEVDSIHLRQGNSSEITVSQNDAFVLFEVDSGVAVQSVEGMDPVDYMRTITLHAGTIATHTRQVGAFTASPAATGSRLGQVGLAQIGHGVEIVATAPTGTNQSQENRRP